MAYAGSRGNEMQDLKPCPFCGSKDLDVTNITGEGEENWIECNQCACMGTYRRQTKEEAISLWNTRSPVAQQPVGETLVPRAGEKAAIQAGIDAAYEHAHYEDDRGCYCLIGSVRISEAAFLAITTYKAVMSRALKRESSELAVAASELVNELRAYSIGVNLPQCILDATNKLKKALA